MSDVATTVTGVQINETGSIWGSGGDKIKGKLNGGGIDLIFKSTYNNVYLRQQ